MIGEYLFPCLLGACTYYLIKYVYFQYKHYLNLLSDDTYQWALQILRTKSETFYFISQLLPFDQRRWIVYLYAYCRVTDDMIDETRDLDQAKSKLAILDEFIQCVYQTDIDWCICMNDFFEKYQMLTQNEVKGLKLYHELVKRFHIDRSYSELLIRGYKHDVLGSTIDTTIDLVEYSMCVAGSVGMIICVLFGINQVDLLKGAMSYGIALQLTNISRDIITDARLGRVYIPSETLGCTPDEFLDRINTGKIKNSDLHRYAVKIVNISEPYYLFGISSLNKLPISLKYSFLFLGFIYRAIGIKIKNNNFYEQRTRLTWTEKILQIPKALWFYYRGQ
jgi:phytoene/squalene synthetase